MIYQTCGTNGIMPQFTLWSVLRKHSEHRLHKLRRSPVEQVSRVTALAQVETSTSDNAVSTAYWDARRHLAGALCQRPGPAVSSPVGRGVYLRVSPEYYESLGMPGTGNGIHSSRKISYITERGSEHRGFRKVPGLAAVGVRVRRNRGQIEANDINDTSQQKTNSCVRREDRMAGRTGHSSSSAW